jgi:hypothetical protein
MLGDFAVLQAVAPTTTITVAKYVAADFTNLTDALASLPASITTPYVIQFLDKESYDESVTISPTVTGAGSIKVLGKFDNDGRTRIFDSEDEYPPSNTPPLGALITVNSDNVWIKGLELDRFGTEENDAASCIDVNGDNCTISHNHILGQMPYVTVPRTTDFGESNGINVNFASAGDTFIYNNLFKGWGTAGLSMILQGGHKMEIIHNTFVKCQEAIQIPRYSNWDAPRDVTIKGNVFDMNPIWTPDCNHLWAILFRDGAWTPDLLSELDYNFYFLRNTHLATTMYIWRGQGGANPPYATIADLQVAHPTLEVNGIDRTDPKYRSYCSDYRPLPDSPMLAQVPADARFTDDNDGVTRPTVYAMGCYDILEGYNLYRAPQIDKLQNDTYWYELTNTLYDSDSAHLQLGPRNFKIDLDYIRIM